MTTIEVETRKTKQGAESAARRLNLGAFDGQRYSVERIAAHKFAVVLFDGAVMPCAPKLTDYRSEPRSERFGARDFAALGGKRTHRDMRGSGDYIVYG